jgi:hypothetical protein
MVSLKVNGLSVEANATPDTPLLWGCSRRRDPRQKLSRDGSVDP